MNSIEVSATSPRSRHLPLMLRIQDTARKAQSEGADISAYTIRLLFQRGKVKGFRAGAGRNGKILINWDSLCDYLERGDESENKENAAH